MHLFDVINLYISLYNFGQTLRLFDSPRFLEWLIIWNGESTSHALCLWSYLCDSQDHIGTTDTHFMFWCHLFCHLSWFAAIFISVRLERACSSMFEVQIQWKHIEDWLLRLVVVIGVSSNPFCEGANLYLYSRMKWLQLIHSVVR